MDEPLLGEWYVILLPMTFIMLYPYVIRPIEMTADITANCQIGTGALLADALPVLHAENMTAQGATALPTSLAPCAKDAVQAVRTWTKEYVCSTSLEYFGACS